MSCLPTSTTQVCDVFDPRLGWYSLLIFPGISDAGLLWYRDRNTSGSVFNPSIHSHVRNDDRAHRIHTTPTFRLKNSWRTDLGCIDMHCIRCVVYMKSR